MVKKIKKKKDKTTPEIDFVEVYLNKISLSKYESYLKLKADFHKNCITKPKILNYITNVKLKNLSDLKPFEKRWILEADKIEDEIKFFVGVLSFYKKEINTFLKLKTQFEELFLIGKLNEATEVLNQIEEECGYSLWSIENRINLLELLKGVKAQKEYIKGIVENEDYGFLVRYVAYHYSYKIQSKTEDEHAAFFKYFFQESEEDESYDYIKYKFNYLEEYSSLKHLKLILRMEMRISIYDGYEALIKIFQILFIQDKVSEEILKVIDLFFTEFNRIEDIRVNKLYETLYCNMVKNNQGIVECFNLYEKGLYEDCLNECEKRLNQNSLEFEIYDIYLNTLLILGRDVPYDNKSIIYRYFDLVKNLKILKKDFKDTLEEINKIIRVYSINSWSITFLYIKDTILKRYNLEKEKIELYQLNNNFYDLKNLMNYSENIYKNLYEKNKKEVIFILLNSFYKNDYKSLSEINIPEERKVRYLAECNYKNKNYNETINLIESQKESNEYLSNLILESYILSYLKIGKIEKVIKILVEKFINNKNRLIYLPINQVIREVKLNSLRGQIEVPIVYNIYYRQNEREDNFKEYIEYEEFLKFYKKEKPSELLENNLKNNLDEEKLNYYLENICTIQIMELSTSFLSKTEIIDERIKICKYLIEKNSTSKLIDEIFRLNKQKLLDQGMEQLNDGKINLNIEELKKIMVEQLEIKFEVCKNNLNMGIEFENEIFEPLKLFSDEEPDIEKVESVNLLHRLVYEARNVFISNEKFGLDTCLSTQIRHGIIINALRSVFEEMYLITKKDINGNYLTNTYWVNLLINEENLENKEKLIQILNIASKQIDDLSLKVKNDLIQILTEQTKDKKSGLFDYYLYYPEVNEWCEEIKKMETIQEFAIFMMENLIVRTHKNLEEVKKCLRTKILNEFLEILNTCLKEVTDLNNLEVTEFRNKVSLARQSIQVEINKIIKWFSMNSKNNISEYDGEFLKELLLSSIKCELDVDDQLKSKFKGETLNGIFHVLYNLTLNAVNHSGKENVRCYIKFIETSELEIIVKNEVITDNELLDKKIKEISKKLESEKQIKLNLEGGTGFNKIKNILDNIMKVKNKILVYSESNNFIVKITLDKKEVLH